MYFAPKTIFLCALVITSLTPGCSGLRSSPDSSVWQLQADADYYLSNPDPSLGYKTLKAPINFASLNEEYRSQSARISALTRDCRDWAVLQTISLSTQSIASKWLCVGGHSQGAGEFGVEDGKGFSRPVRVADVTRVMTTTVEEFAPSDQIDFSRFTALDASAVFVTVKRDEIFRRSRYDANAGHFESDYPESRDGADTPFDKAYLHFLENFEGGGNAQ